MMNSFSSILSTFPAAQLCSHRILLLCLVLVVLWPTGWAAGGEAVVPAGSNDAASSFVVTIEEEAGIARRSEPTKVSLPFAVGMLKEKEGVAITDGTGREVPAQLDVLARWDDGSIRWLLAHFLADVPANGTLTLTVRRGHASSAATGPDLIREEGQNLVVDAGPIRVQAGPDWRDGFWVTDKAGNALLAERPQLVVYSPTGKQYGCGPADKVELEDNGPLYGSVFLAGPMEATEPDHDDILRRETRLHFWKGSARVLAEHSVVAIGGAKDGITIIDGIVVDLKSAGGLSRYVFAGQEESHAGPCNQGDQLRLKQTCAYWHESLQGTDPVAEPVTFVVLEADFGYELSDQTSRLLGKGEKSQGWLWTGGPERSIGVVVRDFWEEGPKALHVAEDGSLGVECYAHWQPKAGEPRPPRSRTPNYAKDPRLDNWFATKDPAERVKRFLEDTDYPGPVRRGPFRFGRGRAKTTDVLYLFGQADQEQVELDALRARRHYLIPVVAPRYLASTRALPLIWKAAADSGLPVFEEGLRGMFENWRKHATRYGFLHYGDDQCGFGYNRTVPSTTDDQEYDTAAGLTMQYGRTGNTDYLRWANVCARHLMDVDQVHYSGNLHFHGYAAGGDYHEENVRCDMRGHPYIGGIVNHYMLTGDRRSLRGINMLAEALQSYGSDARTRVLQRDGRSTSRAGICLAAIYDLTHDPAHLVPVKRMVDVINDLSGDVTNELRGGPPFRMWWINHCEMCYHIRELLTRYHAATGDPRTLATLQKALDLYIYDLWDSQHNAWRGFFGAPFDFNMQYEHAVARKGRTNSFTAAATAEIGMTFAYAAMVTGNNDYLAPFLHSLEHLGADWAKQFANRQFARHQLWSLPLVSMLPVNWRSQCDTIVQREVFRAGLREGDKLAAWTPEGEVTGKAHGYSELDCEILWADSPFGKVLRTYQNSFVTFPAPKDILRMPGTVSFWVRKDAAKWDCKPWPWYGELRGLLHIGSDARETNALDLMMLKDNLWTRLYDQRAWEMVAIETASPAWAEEKWHHIAVVWNRFDLTVFIDGVQVGHDDRFALPDGGQTTIYLGWRPMNRYGQADFHDLRVFRAALSPDRVKKIYESTGPKSVLKAP